jgi:hypothetical protein
MTVPFTRGEEINENEICICIAKYSDSQTFTISKKISDFIDLTSTKSFAS